MEQEKPFTAAVRVEFQVNLKAVQHTIRRSVEVPSRLRRTLVLAHQLKHLLDSRRVGSMVKLAKWLKLTYGRVSQIMSLLYLAPGVQEQILCSKDPWIQQVTEEEARKIASELVWEKQRKRWEHLVAYHRALVEDAAGPGGPGERA